MNEKQQLAILLMAEGLQYQQIAEKVGVTKKTISQWRADYEFRAALNQHLNEIRSAHSEKLRSLQKTALEIIEQSLVSPETPAKDKLNASFKILEIGKITVNEIGSTDANVIAEQDQFNALFGGGMFN